MQEGGWLPAFIVPAATSPTTMPVGSHAAGDSPTARPHLSPRWVPPTPFIPSSASRTPRQHQPHANPNSIKPRQREHSVPRQPDRTEPRPHANPDPERSPAQAQPSPAQKLPQPLPRHRRGSSAGRCRCSPWSPGGTRSAAGRGARHRPASGTGQGRDGTGRDEPPQLAGRKK